MRLLVATGLSLTVVGCGLLSPKPGVDRGDPRFAPCNASDYAVEAAFSFTASAYQTHFPRMLRAPELEVDLPAFAVVFAEGYEPATYGKFWDGPDKTTNDASAERFICVYVGDPLRGEAALYGGVDITGMRE